MKNFPEKLSDHEIRCFISEELAKAQERGLYPLVQVLRKILFQDEVSVIDWQEIYPEIKKQFVVME